MTTETAAVAEITTRLATAKAAWSAYTLIIETDNNKLVDQTTQVNPYLKASVLLYSADQMDMADNPFVKQRGQILLMVVAKENTGMAPTRALRDFLTPYFDLENLGTVQCQAAERHLGRTINGWEHTPLVINFWYTRVST